MTRTAVTKTAISKTAAPLAALAGMLLCTLPAQAQDRVFVSGGGVDTNPCTYAAPCRSFQQAYNTAPANSEIDVLDPAGYGPLTIAHGISIQGHGFSGITQTSSTGNSAAVTISVTTSDPVSLNGLLLDGGGTGVYGIYIASGSAVQILNCVVRHFEEGIYDASSTASADLLIEDTVASDNSQDGIFVTPSGSGTPVAMLGSITANYNGEQGVLAGAGTIMIKNSVISNNYEIGLNSNGSAAIWLAKSAITGNGRAGGYGEGGVYVFSGTVNSYGDNDINGNFTNDVFPSDGLTAAYTR